MKLYLDDNSVERLRKAGHEVTIPADAGLSGASDAKHVKLAIESGLVVVTYDREDFTDLHDLVLASGGTHRGILLILRENNPSRDMTPRGIVTAIGKLEASKVSLENQLYVLNHWR